MSRILSNNIVLLLYERHESRLFRKEIVRSGIFPVEVDYA